MRLLFFAYSKNLLYLCRRKGLTYKRFLSLPPPWGVEKPIDFWLRTGGAVDGEDS